MKTHGFCLGVVRYNGRKLRVGITYMFYGHDSIEIATVHGKSIIQETYVS